MSDLIERLRTDGPEAADQLEAQQAEITAHEQTIESQWAEIARLRELVETAYKEGAFDGQYFMGGEVWERSTSFKALEQKPSPDLPSDVVRLIIAARTMALGDWYSESEGYEVARKELDDAAEAFASRVEWPDTPSEQKL